jgi:hypothetical protein
VLDGLAIEKKGNNKTARKSAVSATNESIELKKQPKQ